MSIQTNEKWIRTFWSGIQILTLLCTGLVQEHSLQ